MTKKILLGIINLIKWFPVIWNDMNWDQRYIYVALRHKLKMAEPVIRNGLGTTSEARADKMKLCIMLLNRIIEDEYLENAIAPVDRKWGEVKFLWRDSTNKPGYSTLFKVTRENAITGKERKTSEDESLRSYLHADYMRKQDIDYLFNIMKKHIEGWWD